MTGEVTGKYDRGAAGGRRCEVAERWNISGVQIGQWSSLLTFVRKRLLSMSNSHERQNLPPERQSAVANSAQTLAHLRS